jgi:hypothetical protein
MVGAPLSLPPCRHQMGAWTPPGGTHYGYAVCNCIQLVQPRHGNPLALQKSQPVVRLADRAACLGALAKKLSRQRKVFGESPGGVPRLKEEGALYLRLRVARLRGAAQPVHRLRRVRLPRRVVAI